MIDPAETLLEAAASAFRERDATGRILPDPAWCDLTEDDRERLFDLQLESRALERLVSADGLSGTARCVLARIAGLPQLGAETDE